MKRKAVDRFMWWLDRHARIIEIISIFVIVFSLGFIANDYLASRRQDDLFKNGRDLPEILYLIEQAYVDEIDVQSKMPGVFQGVLNSVDESASYIGPGPQAPFYARACYDRTGISMVKTNRYPYIMAVAPNSPADKAGMRSGMYIMRIQGEATNLLNLHQVRQRLATSKETLEMSVYLPNTDGYKDFKLEGGEWSRSELSLEKLEEDIFRVSLGDFAIEKMPDFENLIREIPKNAALLLDMRHASSDGFELTQALASVFMPKGELGLFKGSGEERFPQENTRDGWFLGRDLYLLVSHTTGGGAEAFAALAQDREFCPVIGEQTLGKPFYYEDISLGDKGYLRMSTRYFMLAEDKPFTNRGLKPKLDLESHSLKDRGKAFLDEAIKTLKDHRKNKLAKKEEAEKPRKKRRSQDKKG